MKYIPVAWLILMTSAVYAEDPPELVKLRETYQNEIRRVTAPINEKYVGALNRLQKNFTTSNQLEAAIKVRDAIEQSTTLTSATVESIATLAAPEGNAIEQPEKTNHSGDESVPLATGEAEPLRSWKGDGQIRRNDGAEVLLVETDRVDSRKIERSYPAADFPKGMRLHVYYRTSDYVGTGMKLKGYFNTRDYLFRTIPFIADGEWHEYVYNYESSKYREAKEIRFQIEVLGGTGEIEFRNLKVTAL